MRARTAAGGTSRRSRSGRDDEDPERHAQRGSTMQKSRGLAATVIAASSAPIACPHRAASARAVVVRAVACTRGCCAKRPRPRRARTRSWCVDGAERPARRVQARVLASTLFR
jgi:hypothetical protein